MRVLDGGLSALLLSLDAVLASEVLFTTVRINTGLCTPTGGSNSSNDNGNRGNSTNAVIEDPVSSSYGTYSFKGFYPVPDRESILKTAANKAEVSKEMTPKVCGAFCMGLLYFVIQNGDQCSCGDSPPTGTPEKFVDTATTCSGDNDEICGAAGYGIVYQKDGTSVGSPSSTPNLGPVTTIVTGTMSDSAGIHTFTSTEVISPSTTMTVTGGASFLSSHTTAYAMGLSIPSTFSVQSSISSTVDASSSTDTSASSTSASASLSSFSSSLSSTAGRSITSLVSSSTSAGSSSSPTRSSRSSSAASSCIHSSKKSSNSIPPNSISENSASRGSPFSSSISSTNLSSTSPSSISPSSNSTSPSSTPSRSTSPSRTSSSSTFPGSTFPSSTFSSSTSHSSSSSGTISPSRIRSSITPSSSSSSSNIPPSSTSPSSTSSSSTSFSGTSSSGTSSGSTLASTLSPIASITLISSTSTLPSDTYSFAPEQTSIGIPSCPTSTGSPNSGSGSNNTVYVDIFGYPYYFTCGLDLIGSNSSAAHADTFPKCLEYCDLLVGCAAVTYTDGAASTAGNCFPYSSFDSYSGTTAGIYSGVPQNGTSNGAIQASPDLCASGPNGYNQSVYPDYFGNDYFIGCDQNVAGSGPTTGDSLKATVADTLLGCLTYCSIYDTCVGVEFTGLPVPSSGVNCFPYFSTGAISYAPGIQMAYLDG